MATTVIRDQTRRSPWPWVILGLVLLGLLIGALLVRRPQVAAPAPVAVVAPTVHAPAIPAPATVDAVGDLNAFLGRTVLNFATGSAQIPDSATPVLQQAADRIRALPAGTVINISGHTDNVGNPASNMTLSQRRADAVRDALVADGVDPAMLTATGYGQTMPIAQNDTEAGRYQNRRIAFSVAAGDTAAGVAGQAANNAAGQAVNAAGQAAANAAGQAANAAGQAANAAGQAVTGQPAQRPPGG